MHHWEQDRNQGKTEGEKIAPGSLKIWDMGGNKKNKKGKLPASDSASEAGSGTPTQPTQPAINPYVGARYTPINPSAGHPSIPAPSARLDGGFNSSRVSPDDSDEYDSDVADRPVTKTDLDGHGDYTEKYRVQMETAACERVDKYREDAHRGIKNPLFLECVREEQVERYFADPDVMLPYYAERKKKEDALLNGSDEETPEQVIARRKETEKQEIQKQKLREEKNKEEEKKRREAPERRGADTMAGVLEDVEDENLGIGYTPTPLSFQEKELPSRFKDVRRPDEESWTREQPIDVPIMDTSRRRKATPRSRRKAGGIVLGTSAQNAPTPILSAFGTKTDFNQTARPSAARVDGEPTRPGGYFDKENVWIEDDTGDLDYVVQPKGQVNREINAREERAPTSDFGLTFVPDRVPNISGPVTDNAGQYQIGQPDNASHGNGPGEDEATVYGEPSRQNDQAGPYWPAASTEYPSHLMPDGGGNQSMAHFGDNTRQAQRFQSGMPPINTSAHGVHGETAAESTVPDFTSGGHGPQSGTGFGEYQAPPPSSSQRKAPQFKFQMPPEQRLAQKFQLDPALADPSSYPGDMFAPPSSVVNRSTQPSTGGPPRPARKKSGDIVKRQGITGSTGEPRNDTGNHTHRDQQYANSFTAGGTRSSLPNTDPAAAPQGDGDGDEPIELDDRTALQTTDEIRKELEGVLPSDSDEDPMERDPMLSPRYQPESPSTYPKPEQMEIDSNKEASRGPKENPQNVSSGSSHFVSPPHYPPSRRELPRGRIPTYHPEYQRNSNDATTSGVGGSNGSATTPRSPDSTDPFRGNCVPPIGDTAMEPYETCGDENHDELVEKLNVALKSEAEAKDKVKDYDRMKRELDESKKGGKIEEMDSEKCKAKCTELEKELAKVRAEFDAFKLQHQDCKPSTRDDQGVVQSTTPSSKTSNPGLVKLPGLQDSMYAKSPPRQPDVPNQDPDVEMGEDGMDNASAPLQAIAARPAEVRPTDVATLTSRLNICEDQSREQGKKLVAAEETVERYKILVNEHKDLVSEHKDLEFRRNQDQAWIQSNKGEVGQCKKTLEKVENDLKKAKEDLEEAKKAALKAEGDLKNARGEHTAAQNVLQAAKEAEGTKLEASKQQVAQLITTNNELYKEASKVQAEHNQCGQKQMVAVAAAEEVAKTELEKSKKKQAELEKGKKAAAERLQKLQTEHAKCKKNQADALAAAAKKWDEEKAALGPRRTTRQPGEKRPEKCTVQRHREYKEMIRMAAEATTSMVDTVTRMQNRWEALP
ncbi:hypothetical protein TI39_contig4202g00020 [Zymoseptoria brevis]|uniref:Uncharacterized protein n=1 Tax=Zymoseptoria brevis TaxID=1047168 RepID=A0A0F4GA99_9PEZI|nr:hypothetical protein TI39_contig4202g00020 [Zymoseptoria brevis]